MIPKLLIAKLIPFIAPSGQGVRSQEPVVRINLIIKQFFLLIPSLPNRV